MLIIPKGYLLILKFRLHIVYKNKIKLLQQCCIIAIFSLLQHDKASRPLSLLGVTKILNKMKGQKRKLTLDELKVDSFVTSVSSDVSKRLAGGAGQQTHPTHTQRTDPLHPSECTCPSQVSGIFSR